MAQIRVKGSIESLYKLRTVVIVALIIDIILTNSIDGSIIPAFLTRFLPNTAGTLSSLVTFFSNGSLLTFYGTIIGLLMAAYTVMITMIPSFHPESLKQPIFTQINRLFLFTILVGITLMILSFTSSLIPGNSTTIGTSSTASPLFIQIQIFFFFSILIGLIFSVLSLSDLFKVVSGRKFGKDIITPKTRDAPGPRNLSKK